MSPIHLIEYSIIIPHKNIPQLLQRCLDSIPVRNDVQVIVVDDNSDADKVNFDNFPKWKGENYEYYLTKEGKGAGYARNVGIKHAKGRWILFADADDKFLTSNFSKLLDAPKEKYDVICWPTEILNTNGTTEPFTMTWRYGKDTFNKELYGNFEIYDNYLPDILYVLYAPWHKMTKLSLIKKHSLSYSEIPACNDIYFSTCLATKTTNIGIFSDVVYLYIKRNNSISDVNIYKLYGTKRLEFHLKELFKVQKILCKQKKEQYIDKDINYVFELLEKLSIKKTLWFCLLQMKDVSMIMGVKSLKTYMTYKNLKILFNSFLHKFSPK